MNLLVALIVLIVVIIVISIIGKFIWNRFLVPNVTFARPLNSWIDFLMILILVLLLFGLTNSPSCVTMFTKQN